MSIQHAFAHITHEARTPYIPSMLRYQLLPQGQELAVRSSWLGRRKIWLFLPIDAVTTIGQTELEVLLATGLARSMCARKPPYPLARLLLAGVVLIACLTPIFFWMHHVPLVGLPLAIALCAGVAWLWDTQARSLAFRADTLMVLWLGRKQVCSGLHVLAERSRASRRRRWGEPSLVERIERVCGARVGAREDQLTLVR